MGRPRLLDVLRKSAHCLLDGVMDYCWRRTSADERLYRMGMPRFEILLRAASEPGGACAHMVSQCTQMYESILAHQGLDSIEFRHALYLTFEHGRRTGSRHDACGWIGHWQDNQHAVRSLHVRNEGHAAVRRLLPSAGCTGARSVLVAGLQVQSRPRRSAFACAVVCTLKQQQRTELSAYSAQLRNFAGNIPSRLPTKRVSVMRART